MTAGPTAAPGGISSAHAPDLDLPARFMVLAMVALATLAAVAPWGIPSLLDGFYAPHLLAFVHLMTVGVIATMIVGASYQLVPVVLQTELAAPRLGRVTFWIHLTGIALFLPGIYATWPLGLAIGSVALFSGLILFIGIIAMTLRQSPRLDGIAWHIVISLLGLLGGVTFGVTLALNKTTGFLGDMTLPILAAHASLMLGGWVLPMLNGVAFRLVGMFTLAENRIHSGVVWAELALVAGGSWLLALTLLLRADRWSMIGATTLLIAGELLFLGQLAHLYRKRMRRAFDIHMPYALLAASSGPAAAALLAIGLAMDLSPSSTLWVAVGWLLIAGAAITAIQGFFYKIATFLVWLNRYAPLAGRVRVPRLEEMYNLRLARVGLTVWTLALALSVLSLAADSRTGAQLSGFAVLVAIGCFLGNVVMIVRHWRPRAVKHERYPESNAPSTARGETI